jgi:hypothetical protein
MARDPVGNFLALNGGQQQNRDQERTAKHLPKKSA